MAEAKRSETIALSSSMATAAASDRNLGHTSTDVESQEHIVVAHGLYEVEDQSLQNTTSDEDKCDKSTASIEDKSGKKKHMAKNGASTVAKNKNRRIIDKN